MSDRYCPGPGYGSDKVCGANLRDYPGQTKRCPACAKERVVRWHHDWQKEKTQKQRAAKIQVAYVKARSVTASTLVHLPADKAVRVIERILKGELCLAKAGW